MANAETNLKVLMAATHQWLNGRELPLVNLTGVPQALWMLQGAIEDVHHHLANDREISEAHLFLYEEALRNAGFLMAFMHSQPEHVKEALKDDIDEINKVLYQAELAADQWLRPWLL